MLQEKIPKTQSWEVIQNHKQTKHNKTTTINIKQIDENNDTHKTKHTLNLSNDQWVVAPCCPSQINERMDWVFLFSLLLAIVCISQFFVIFIHFLIMCCIHHLHQQLCSIDNMENYR